MSRMVPQGDRAFAPPEFGIDAHAVRTITIPLDTALDKKEIAIGGNVLWAVSASDGTAEMDVHLNEQGNDAITVSRGFFMRGVSFSRIFVTCDAQAGKTLTLLYVVEGHNNVQIENPNVNQNEVEIVGPLTAANDAVKAYLTGPGPSATSGISVQPRVVEIDATNSRKTNFMAGSSADYAANTSRSRLWFKADSANGSTFTIQVQNPSAVWRDIVTLAAGQEAEFHFSNAFRVVNDDGINSQSIFIVEEFYG